MAGAKIHLDYDASTTIAALDYVSSRLDSDGRQLLLSHIGEYMVGSTRDRAARQVDPDGRRWRALSPAYARWKQKKRPGVPILKFDNHMIGDQFTFQLDGDAAVDIGTNAIYGAKHQFGPPARVWLGVSDEDDEEIVLITRDHLLAGLPES
jgi:phage virion morphogenesis protein